MGRGYPGESLPQARRRALLEHTCGQRAFMGLDKWSKGCQGDNDVWFDADDVALEVQDGFVHFLPIVRCGRVPLYRMY